LPAEYIFLDIYSALLNPSHFRDYFDLCTGTRGPRYSFRTFAEKAWSRRWRRYYLRRARSDVFYNLPRDAISISDRSISHDTCTHGNRDCSYTDVLDAFGIYASTRTHVRTLTFERSHKDESMSLARTDASLFPRCYANERASPDRRRSSETNGYPWTDFQSATSGFASSRDRRSSTRRGKRTPDSLVFI
jgi:hypothetical protein